MIAVEEGVDRAVQYMQQLKAIGGIEKRKKDKVYICFSTAALCGLNGIELYVSFDGVSIIGGRNENREMELEEVLRAVRRFNHNYYYSCQTKKWVGDLSVEDTETIKEMVNAKIKEMNYAGKRKPL